MIVIFLFVFDKYFTKVHFFFDNAKDKQAFFSKIFIQAMASAFREMKILDFASDCRLFLFGWLLLMIIIKRDKSHQCKTHVNIKEEETF